MPKQDVIDYIFETPLNTNPAILNQKLDELVSEGGTGGVTSSDDLNKIKILPDKTMEINGLTIDKLEGGEEILETANNAASAAASAQETANSKISSLNAADASIVISGTTAIPTVNVQISKAEKNILSLSDDGIKAIASEYNITTEVPGEDADEDKKKWSVIYHLTKDNQPIGTSINIPKDMVVSKGAVEVNPIGQSEGTYLVLTLANATNDKVYIDVKKLVDLYTGATAADGIITIAVSDSNVITATITNGSIVKNKLSNTVQTSLDKADSALQKLDIAEGSNFGTIAVKNENIKVHGLSTVVTDVQIDGNSIVQNDVANISLSESLQYSNNTLQISQPTNENITQRANKALTLNKIDDAVKAALCDGTGATWSTEEQAAARTRLDIITTNGTAVVQAPKYVDSTSEMTDINRLYILKSSGHIWANANTEIEVPVTETIEATDENPYHDACRLGSDSTTDSMTAGATGYFLTPLIDLTKAVYQGKTIQLHLEGAHFASESTMDTWIQARAYGTDKSVLVNRYFTMADITNDNGIAHHCNGTMSITYNSETSATITFTVPPTYGNDATTIGYIRFCAQGTIASSSITVTYTNTSTGVQWYDTGMTYGSTQDSQLTAKVATLNNEGNSPSTYNLLTPAVIAYYNKAAYSDDDYSTTNFVRTTLPYRSDISQPVTLKWTHNENAVQTTISINTSATVLSTSVMQYDATGYDNYPIYNLLPGKTYYYIVTHLLSDGSVITAKNGSFTTNSIPWRLLKIAGIQNVRDLGGWSGLNGQKVKYGKLFRGSAVDDSTLPNLVITGEGRHELISTLGVRADLDLRYSYTESTISKDMTFLCAGYGSYAQAITTEGYRTTFKTILEWIVTQLSETPSKPVYFHCQGGCDRTGTLAFILMGLLGVNESDLAREYELSSFSSIGTGRLRNSTVYGYSAMVTALKAYSGDTITEKFVDFATTGCGISTKTINNFRTLMLE